MKVVLGLHIHLKHYMAWKGVWGLKFEVSSLQKNFNVQKIFTFHKIVKNKCVAKGIISSHLLWNLWFVCL
jgi:hypothetical protein